MFSVAQLLDSAKAGGNIESDYRLAKVIGITQSAVSNYRSQKTMPDARVLEQLCALSGDDVAVVMAQIQAERERTPEGKNMWLMVAARLRGAATTAILSVCFAISFIATDASNARASTVLAYQSGEVNLLHIVSSTIFSVAHNLSYCLLVRLRQFAAVLRLFSAAFPA